MVVKVDGDKRSHVHAHLERATLDAQLEEVLVLAYAFELARDVWHLCARRLCHRRRAAAGLRRRQQAPCLLELLLRAIQARLEPRVLVAERLGMGVEAAEEVAVFGAQTLVLGGDRGVQLLVLRGQRSCQHAVAGAEVSIATYAALVLEHLIMHGCL